MADGALGFCLAQLNSDEKDGPKSLVKEKQRDGKRGPASVVPAGPQSWTQAVGSSSGVVIRRAAA